MRSFLFFLLTVAFLIGSAFVLNRVGQNLPASPSPKNNVNRLIEAPLVIGSSGEDVKIIQAALSLDKAVYPEGIVSGYYGDLTKEAVENFQTKYELSVTGGVDQATADKFNEVYGSRSRDYYLSLHPTPVLVELQVDNPIVLDEWGKATQIGEHTWTMKVGFDDRMATPQEIFEALNNYRSRHGKSTLAWDDRLASYAQTRASYFTQNGDLDEHKGFEEYVTDENNLKSLGFWAVGENSSYGYRLTGVHLIEWVYAGDKPHDDNQLHSDWTHVGIGVDGYQTNLIFGGYKM